MAGPVDFRQGIEDTTSFFTGGEAVGGSSSWQRASGIVERVHMELKRARDQQMNWRRSAGEAVRFYDGNQWDRGELMRMQELSKPAITYNRSGPMIDLIVGYEIQNRQRMLFIPRDPIDNPDSTGTADLMTGAYEWALELCDGDYERSKAFRDCLVTGIGWVSDRMDYDVDADGIYKMEWVDGEEMWYDPGGAPNQNLEGIGWVSRRRMIHIDEIERRFGKKVRQKVASNAADTETGLMPHDMNAPSRITEFSPNYYSPGAIDQEPGIRDLSEQQAGFVELIDFQWCEYEPIVKVFHEDGTTETIAKDEWKELKKMARKAGEEMPRAVEMSKKVVKRVWVSGPTQLDDIEEFPFPYFTYRACTYKWDKKKREHYGLMRALMDPQKGANKYFSLAVHLLSISPKGTYLVEENALKYPQTFQDDIAKPGAVVYLNEGALAEQKIKLEPPPEIPAVTQSLLDFSIRSLHDVAGIQPEALGMTSDGTPQRGAPMQKLQTQGMTILAPIFNAFSRFRRQEARSVMEFLRFFLADDRFIRIGGPFDSQYLPLARDEIATRMDLALDDVPVDPNERRYVWESMQPHFPMMMREQMFDAEFFDLAPWPKSIIERIKRKWREREEQAQQMGQEPQRKDENPEYIQSETEVNKAQAEWLRARAHALLRESDMDLAQATQEIMHKDRDAKWKKPKDPVSEMAKAANQMPGGVEPPARASANGSGSLDQMAENGRARSPKFPGTRSTNNA